MVSSPSNRDSASPARELPQLHITAMGSSFAAGPGISPRINKAAMRSGNNYAHILANRLNGRLTDLTVSGATLNNLNFEPQVTWRTTFAPQVSLLTSDIDIVTITAGGNDMGYIGNVVGDTFKASYLGKAVGLFLPAAKEMKAKLTAEDIAERFVDLIDGILKIAPESRIFLVEYLTLFGSDVKAGVDVWLSEEQILHYRDVAKELQRGYKLAGERRQGKCKVIDIAEKSWDHGLGSKEPWVEGFDWGMLVKGVTPFHPNVKGMMAVAEILYDALEMDESSNKR